MAEQTNNVSSGLSPVLKAVKSGRAELTATAETATQKSSGFSSDLDKARQQQMGKAGVEPATGASRKEGAPGAASGVKSLKSAASSDLGSQSDESRLANDSLSGVTDEIDVIGKPITIEIDDASNPLLSVTSQPRTELADESGVLSNDLTTTLASLTPVRTVEATPAHASGLPAAGLTTPSGLPKETPAPTAALTATPTPVLATELPTALTTDTVDQVSTPVTAQLLEQQRIKPTSVTEQEALELRASAKTAGVPNGSSMGSTTQAATLTAPAAQLVSGLEVSKTDDGPVAHPALSADEGLNTNAGSSLKEQPLDLTASRTIVEQSAVMTNAATLAKGRVSVAGEAMGAAVTATPETLVTDTSGPQQSAVELTQLASGNGIVTQATLAGRFHPLNREVSAPGTKVQSAATLAGQTQAVLPGLSSGVTESLAVDDMPVPLVDESLSGMEALKGGNEATPTVQQRIAATEAMLSQMAQEAEDATIKVAPNSDNVLAAVNGGTVTTAAVQPSQSAAGPIVQAPLNINLTSDDAETALAGNVKWMTNEGVKNAVMTVTPNGMGPISVKIGIDGDQMDVSIIASQHATRDALESMLPRLREQLAVQGHETVKVDVSDGKNEQSRSGNGQTFAESRNPAGASSQDNPSNSRNHDEKTQYGHSNSSELVSESFMAEDLQRVAARAIGEAGSRSVFDAYV